MSAIEVNSSGQFLVIGELSFNSVPDLNLRGCHLIAASPQPVFDFSNVSASDNAGIALLLSWTRYARDMGKVVWFINLPSQLADIIEASGLKAILPIQPE
jgi:phospholipid transport system transporter-binding protein